MAWLAGRCYPITDLFVKCGCFGFHFPVEGFSLTHFPPCSLSYFIPEDGDDESRPNVFLAAKSRHQGVPPSLGQIRDAFPLPGRYHFRFKSPLMPGGDRDKDGMAVWMDCVKDNQPVPTWRNTVVAKVTRTGVEDDDDDDDDFVNGGAAARAHAAAPPPRAVSAPSPQQPAPRSQPPPAQHHEPSLDIFSGPPPSQSMPTSAPPSTGNLLDGHHPAPAPLSGGLLDMDAPYSGGPSNSAHNDFLGMTAPAAGGYNAPNSAQPYGQPAPQQQQQQQQKPQQNAFNNFNQQQQQGPFGGLNWS